MSDLMDRIRNYTPSAPVKTGRIDIGIDGVEFSYKSDEKAAVVTIKNGDHLRQLVAKAIANGAAVGQQIDAYCEPASIKISMALLNEVGSQIVAHNKAMKAGAAQPLIGRHYLRPNWMPNA